MLQNKHDVERSSIFCRLGNILANVLKGKTPEQVI